MEYGVKVNGHSLKGQPMLVILTVQFNLVWDDSMLSRFSALRLMLFGNRMKE